MLSCIARCSWPVSQALLKRTAQLKACVSHQLCVLFVCRMPLAATTCVCELKVEHTVFVFMPGNSIPAMHVIFSLLQCCLPMLSLDEGVLKKAVR